MREISVCSHHQGLKWNEQEILAMFQYLDHQVSGFQIPVGDLSIVFLDAEAMARLHAEYLDDPAPTDVITFPGDPRDVFAGEICVCADVAVEAAADLGEPFMRELTRYLVHGWLHLAGLHDNSSAEYKRMKELEDHLLKELEDSNLSPAFSV